MTVDREIKLYLGVWFDDTLSFKQHIKAKCKTAFWLAFLNAPSFFFREYRTGRPKWSWHAQNMMVHGSFVKPTLASNPGLAGAHMSAQHGASLSNKAAYL